MPSMVRKLQMENEQLAQRLLDEMYDLKDIEEELKNEPILSDSEDDSD